VRPTTQSVGEAETTTRATEEAGAEPRRHERSLSILRVATDLYPDITGGGAIHAHAMSKRQAERGHDVTVLTSDHGERTRPRVEHRDGYRILRHRQLARPFGNSITPGMVGSLPTRLSDADVVHAHSHLYFSTNLAAAVARVADTPLVVTNHGLVSQTAPKWIQKLFLPTVGRFTFNSADQILCYTDTDRKRLRDRGVETAVDVVNNGIDCQQFTPGREPAHARLLFVGRLTDTKGVPTLLQAFARLASSYPDLSLRIVGDGPGRTRYEQTCERLGIDDRVTFVGAVPYDEMPHHYREAIAFVLPSHKEGLPRTVLEAMACETPVVTTALEQLEPVVDGGGVTFERGSVDGLVRAVDALLEDDARRREYGRAGRERVLAENAWSQTVAETTDVLRELAAESA